MIAMNEQRMDSYRRSGSIRQDICGHRSQFRYWARGRPGSGGPRSPFGTGGAAPGSRGRSSRPDPRRNPPADVRVEECDLGDLASVERCAARIREKVGPIDVLINNAGIMAVPYGTTKDGHERQIGTNHLGHLP